MGSWVLAFPACDEGERPFRVPAPRGSLPPRGYRGVLQGRQFAGLSDLQWVGGGSNLCGPEFPGQCGGFAAAVFDPQRLRPFDIPRACEAWPHGRTSVPCPSLVQHFLVLSCRHLRTSIVQIGASSTAQSSLLAPSVQSDVSICS